MVTKLDPAIHQLASGPNYGVLATLMPDGEPQTSVVWVDSDGEHLLVNTEIHRQKFRNVRHDPRATVTIWDHDDPYTYVEVRGDVIETIGGPEARAHIDQLSRRYRGTDYQNPITSERVILKIAPTRRQFVR